ncbi:MAG: Crp/Fnr family transcriptional regulator [Syntrophobacterales bacterium]|nr:Crp/Fnr family transcriptional regulator [Syntrophobacterales bacterium]
MISSRDLEGLITIKCFCGLDEKVSLLRQISAFGAIPIDQLKILATLCPCRKYLEGEFIFRQGEYDSNGYILKSGRVRMIRHYEDRSFILKELEEGEFFGGLALLADIKRLFSAQSVKSSECLIVPREVFKRFVIQFPDISLRMLEIMVKGIVAMEDQFIEMYAKELKCELLY